MSDEQVADLIRNDQVDILVDLAGHTAKNRMLLFARKPAPIQVTYLGYPNTTGLPTMDYRITDNLADPAGQTDHLHTEELTRLPKSFLCYQPPEETPEVSNSPALNTGYVTFGSFNNRAKVTPETVKIWSAILKSVSNSCLILKSKALNDEGTRQTLWEMFSKNGVVPERIELAGYLPFEKHLQLYNRIDIGLDTFPYNGTTTTCEAMWMGVPVIALAGETHVSRVGVSLLTNAGLPELIAESAEEYVEKAVQLACDLKRLQAIRANLRSMMAHSPLMDAQGFTRSLEAAYRQMWHKWCGQGRDRAEDTQPNRSGIDVVTENLSATDTNKTKPSIRILHNMARSGGTIICKCLGCMKDIVMLSEIHPLGLQRFNPIHQAHEWFNLLTTTDMQLLNKDGVISFEDAIVLIYRRCAEHDKTLVIRDWGHLDFTAIPFVPKPSYRLSTAEMLSSKFAIMNTAIVRHPIDQWLSLRGLILLQGKITLDEFLKGYLKLVEYCREIGFIRYEDFCKFPEKEIKQLCERLSVHYDPTFIQNWYEYTTITGDTNSLRGDKRHIKPVPRRKVEHGLLEQFEKNSDYIKSIEILGYGHPI